jgi:hypothetical protein
VTRRSRRLSIAPLLLAAALTAAAGCGASDSNEPPPPKVDACQLFTFEDAQAIAGETLANLSSTIDEAKGRNPLECIYNGGTLDQPRILSLLIRQHRNSAAAKRVQESSRDTLSSMSGGKVQDVAGLGEGAFWVGGRLQQLHVLASSQQLIITSQSSDGSDQLPIAKQIATRSLERLKAAAEAQRKPARR